MKKIHHGKVSFPNLPFMMLAILWSCSSAYSQELPSLSKKQGKSSCGHFQSPLLNQRDNSEILPKNLGNPPWGQNNLILARSLQHGVNTSEIISQNHDLASSSQEVDAFVKESEASAKKMEEAVQEMLQNPSSPLPDLISKSPTHCSGKCASPYDHSQENVSQEPIQLLVFASFSLPPDSLKKLARDTQKSGGRLLFRGLKNNSFAQTKTLLQELKFNLDIDPETFEAYAITHVPTFIVVKKRDQSLLQPASSSQQNPSLSEFDKVQGHMSLEGALTILKDQGSLPETALFLKRLRG